MPKNTKERLASALRDVMEIKPIEKITVKDIVEICEVNRQTFYYHFDDVYDLLEYVFEEDANRHLPDKVVYDHWREDVLKFFEFLYENRSFALNVYNSNSRIYMLRFYKEKLKWCISEFAKIVSRGRRLAEEDYEFVIEIYAQAVVGLISQWLDMGMHLPPQITKEQFIILLDNSVENMLARFEYVPKEI